jgi:predicted MFS family arabinose efflux permease
MLLTGRLWRRVRWWMLPPAGLFFAAAAFGPTLVATPVALAVALFVVGASSGMLDVSMNSAVSDVEVAANRRLMYGAHALFSLGVLVGSFATGLALQAGLPPVVELGTSAAFTMAVAVGCLSVVRRTPIGAAGGETAEPAVAASLLRALAALAVLGLVAFVVEDATQNWSALLLEREIGAGPAIGGAGPGIFAGAMFIGRSSGQWLGARYSDRLLLVTGAAAAAGGLVLASVATVAAAALVGVAFAGAGVALVAPALFARAGRMGDQRNRATAIATMTTVGYSGFVLGPFIVGVLAQAFGLRFAFVALAALAGVVAIGGIQILRPTPARDTYEIGEELLRTSRG